jgi:hypothetical protein
MEAAMRKCVQEEVEMCSYGAGGPSAADLSASIGRINPVNQRLGVIRAPQIIQRLHSPYNRDPPNPNSRHEV